MHDLDTLSFSFSYSQSHSLFLLLTSSFANVQYLLPCYAEINLINSLQPHRFLSLLSFPCSKLDSPCVGMANFLMPKLKILDSICSIFQKLLSLLYVLGALSHGLETISITEIAKLKEMVQEKEKLIGLDVHIMDMEAQNMQKAKMTCKSGRTNPFKTPTH